MKDTSPPPAKKIIKSEFRRNCPSCMVDKWILLGWVLGHMGLPSKASDFQGNFLSPYL
jgi:hypothetical protein